VRSDLSDRRVSLNRYRGKLVLLNFWATWCAPCQVELPVPRTARELHLDFPVMMGDANLGEAFGECRVCRQRILSIAMEELLGNSKARPI